MRRTIGAQRFAVEETALTHYLIAMGLFGLIRFAVFGLIIGALAKFFMPGRDPGGFWITMLLGMAGSVLATWLLTTVGHYQGGQTAGWIASFFGAILLLLIYRMFKGKSS
jgi:uncharacterized membrane protein YeaQ/YmgE (transglycosylase-associated protein family)